MILYTKYDETILYNKKGKIHGSSPLRGVNVPVQVSSNIVNVQERGESRAVLTIPGAYVLASALKDNTANPPPDPEPEPPATGDTFATATVTLEGNEAVVTVTTSAGVAVTVTVNGEAR